MSVQICFIQLFINSLCKQKIHAKKKITCTFGKYYIHWRIEGGQRGQLPPSRITKEGKKKGEKEKKMKEKRRKEGKIVKNVKPSEI